MTTDPGERQAGQESPDIFVRLKKDELGYPPRDWEQLKAEPTATPNVMRIKSIPFYARGLAYDDEIACTKSVEGHEPVFDAVVKRSGYSTIRLLIKKDENRDDLIEFFTGHNTMIEFEGRLVALAIPREEFDALSEYLFAERERRRWASEDGFLIMDE